MNEPSAEPATTQRTGLHLPGMTNPRVKRAALGIVLLIGAAGLSGLIMATGPDGSPEEQTEKAWPVTVMRATPSELHPMFTTYGRVEARTEAKLRTDIQAEVEEVFVQEGEWAQKGELLLKLRDEEIQLRLREANAEADQKSAALKSAQVEYNLIKQTSDNYESMYRISQQRLTRQRELVNKHMIPQALFEDALQQSSRDTIEYQNHRRLLADFPNRINQSKADVAMARARADRAQLNLDKTELRAPFSGPVLEVAVGPGDRTGSVVTLIRMADASSFEVRAAIPDQYAERVRSALAANRTIAARSASGVTPRVTSGATSGGAAANLTLGRIARNVRPGQSGFDAWFNFTANDLASESIPALGRVINLNTILPSEPGLIALPAQAIYENDRVYLVTNNRLQATTIERIGEFNDTNGVQQVLVRGDNLSVGSDVMTTALPKAISGLLVDPIHPVEEGVVNTLAPQSSLQHPLSAAPAPRV